MKCRWLQRVAIVALVLAIWLPGHAGEGVRPARLPAAQARIAELVQVIVAVNRGGSGDGLPEMAERLRHELGGNRVSLLQQILLYRAGRPGNEPAMAVALLIDFYGFTNTEKISAAVPLLESEGSRLRSVLSDLLSTVCRPDGAIPDFGPFEAVLSGSERPPLGLIRYMYTVSSIDALRATAKIYAGEQAATAAVRRVANLEALIDRPDAAKATDLTPMRAELEALSRDDAWWIRLYAAHVAGTHPDLALPEVADALRSDPHPVVRGLASAQGVDR